MPRYDIPKAAPEPLREVQLLVNSVDLHSEDDWVGDWLAERGVPLEEAKRAVALREGLRALVLANNGIALDDAALAVVNRAAARVALRVHETGSLSVAAVGDDALDRVVAIALGAMLDGTWKRLKACRNCHWSFYDYSPNRSATWCSMQICGNRSKTKAYRRRRARRE
ncbi:MAG TPA: CGNR zinc finger domain-containing protein [Gaiellaceae bacterium]|nr:CGNR zinc finger domain-containing protein [Gaiellaceae bacterium]